MRYPNTRYGNPNELKYYAQGIPVKDLAKRLKRSEKSVKQWLSLERKVPYWVPELLRLWHMEHQMTLRQMGFDNMQLKFGVVKDNVIHFPLRQQAQPDHSGCESYGNKKPFPTNSRPQSLNVKSNTNPVFTP